MKLSPRTWNWIWVGGILLLVIALVYLVREGFQNYATAPSNQATECGARTSCGACLTPIRELVETLSTDDCTKKKGIIDTASGKCKTKYQATCGWCPTAQKCVPKVGSVTTSIFGGSTFYPLIPRSNDGRQTTGSLGDPLFACPLSEFVATPDQCADFDCGTFTSCRDCAQSQKCGWCDSTNKCVARATAGGTTAAASATGGCADAARFITSTVKCPVKACVDITDCAECAATSGCGYCEGTRKCLKIVKNQNLSTTFEPLTITPTATAEITLTVSKNLTYKTDDFVRVEKVSDSGTKFNGVVKSYVKDTGIIIVKTLTDITGTYAAAANYNVRLTIEELLEKCKKDTTRDAEETVPITSPTQCPGMRPDRQLTPLSQQAGSTPSSGQLGAIQSNVAGGVGTDQEMATQQMSGSGGGAVSPPQRYTMTGQGGVARPVGTPSVGVTFPAAVSADGETGPFEEYIGMLVKSQLAAQGVPTAEPFAVGDVVRSAGGYLESVQKMVAADGE